MLFSNLEYLPLRLLRKFVFPRRVVEACGRFIPYYLPNTGEASPQTIVSAYISYLRTLGAGVAGNVVLELGSGATNGTGYELVSAGATRVFCLEPFARFKPAADHSCLSNACNRRSLAPAEIAARVDRVRSIETVPSSSIDLLVSSSVLEHVADLSNLCSQLQRVLAPSGKMLHLVDYRDHFFKYPYHFLQFSRRTWNAFLNPGDLPRWRLTDHLRAFADAGFETSILEERSDHNAFALVAPHVSPEFDRSDSRLSVTFAAILAYRKPAA